MAQDGQEWWFERLFGLAFMVIGSGFAYTGLPDPDHWASYRHEGVLGFALLGGLFALIGLGLLFKPLLMRLVGAADAWQDRRDAEEEEVLALPLTLAPLPPDARPFGTIDACMVGVNLTLRGWGHMVPGGDAYDVGSTRKTAWFKMRVRDTSHTLEVRARVCAGIVAELELTAAGSGERWPAWMAISGPTTAIAGAPLPGGTTEAWLRACGLLGDGERGLGWAANADTITLYRHVVISADELQTEALPALYTRFASASARVARAWPEDAETWLLALIEREDAPSEARLQAAAWLLAREDAAHHALARTRALSALLSGDAPWAWGLVDPDGAILGDLSTTELRETLGATADLDDEATRRAFFERVWACVLASVEADPERWIAGTTAHLKHAGALLDALHTHAADLAPDHPLLPLLRLGDAPTGDACREWWWQLGEALAACEAPLQRQLTELIWTHHAPRARVLALARVIPSWTDRMHERVSQQLWRPGTPDPATTDALLSQLWLHAPTDLTRREDLIALMQRHGGPRTLAALKHVAKSGPDLPRSIDTLAEEVIARLEAQLGPQSEHDGMLSLADTGPAGALSVVSGEQGALSQTE